ncbi:A-agglutinin anchorage subunit [Coregonus clupeaformis]|uniref:A-agglutinin anchorage subunit n=1 Tax=Coregonus clupeaformis TaxID=59861 RepID=UPI001E1C3BFB|nr:A-agglutinin anchorage subunit [Coregonus clupeaformis]XP_045066792.1 A-agglutinin anchorage subunit [Coregonus clupeaformis]
MMRVTLISLAMCLPRLLATPVLHSTTAVSPSATEITTTSLDLRIRTTTSDPLKLPLSTTENHPGRTSGTFNTQVKKSASLAAVNNSSRTTQGRGILRTGTATYVTTDGQKSNRHTTAGVLRRETESYIHHETLPFSGHTASPTTDHPSTTTLPGEEGTEYHDSSTTETAREFNTPNSIETWAADTSNDSRLAKPHLDRSQAADQHTATQGLEMASVDTASGDYYTTQRDFFTNTPTNRVTGLNRGKQSKANSVTTTTTTVSPTYTFTLPGLYEHITVTYRATGYKTQPDDTSQSMDNKDHTTATVSIPHADNSTTPYPNANTFTDNVTDNYTITLSYSNTTTSNNRNTTVLLNKKTHTHSLRHNHTISGYDNRLNNTTENTVHARPECGEADERSPSLLPGSTRLVCFIVLWALGLTALVFLGLTVFLWVRLSVQRVRERRVRRGGEKVSGVDLENLWVDQMSSVEERVEFWYANGSTMGPDHKRSERGRERERDRVKERERREQQRQKGRECDNLWTQPKVTLEDITDFWYTNGRAIPEETKDQTLLEMHII